MNIIDLRKKLRRSSNRRVVVRKSLEERRKAERRNFASEQVNGMRKRVWLTKGERTLIEDLYLLDQES